MNRTLILLELLDRQGVALKMLEQVTQAQDLPTEFRLLLISDLTDLMLAVAKAPNLSSTQAKQALVRARKRLASFTRDGKAPSEQEELDLSDV